MRLADLPITKTWELGTGLLTALKGKTQVNLCHYGLGLVVLRCYSSPAPPAVAVFEPTEGDILHMILGFLRGDPM